MNAPPAVEPAESVDFYTPATAPSARPRRTLKCGDTFAVVDSHGDIGASAGGPDGVFHADTRYLSRFELLFNGLQLLLLGSNMSDDNSVLTVDPRSRLNVHMDTDEANACGLHLAKDIELVK